MQELIVSFVDRCRQLLFPEHDRRTRLFAKTMVRLFMKKRRSIWRQIRAKERELEKVMEALASDESGVYVRGRLQASKIRLAGAIERLREECEELHTEKPEMYHAFSAMVAELLKIPRVKDIYISRGLFTRRLVIRTDTLYGQSVSGSWHKIGDFEIRITLRGGVSYYNFAARIRWINHDPDGNVFCGAGSTGRVFGTWAAPTYIAQDGKVQCFGLDGEMLSKAMRELDWVTVVKTVVRFPECPGQSNAIRHWPRVDRAMVPEWYLRTEFPDRLAGLVYY